jgi:RNA polymerase primary sigma factor
MRQLKITQKITSRESISLDKYLNDIGKIHMLASDEEADLARRIREGDQEALDRLTGANLRFVVSVAKQYQNQGISLIDLINEGNMGLIKAARRFDETKGFKFISYAVWWIRQSILQSIVDHSRIVRLPLNKMGAYNKVNEAYLAFIQEHEREPSHEELAEVLDLSERTVADVLKTNFRHTSMDSPLRPDENDSDSLIDLMADDDQATPDNELIQESLRAEMRQGMRGLSEREIDVLNAFYGLNKGREYSLDEIGAMYNLSRERVRQIKERAIRRLRRSAKQSDLKTYL